MRKERLSVLDQLCEERGRRREGERERCEEGIHGKGELDSVGNLNRADPV